LLEDRVKEIETELASELSWATIDDELGETSPAHTRSFTKAGEEVDRDKPRYDPIKANRTGIERAGRLGTWRLCKGRTLLSTCHILSKRGVRYVAIPAAVGDGQALLVSDDDIPRVKDLITRSPFGEQVAVYCTTDLPGFSYQQHWRRVIDATNMAIMPPYLSQAMLDGGRIDDRGVRVPAAEDVLLWAVYRALYLGGDENFACGSPNESAPILLGKPAQLIKELSRITEDDFQEPIELTALQQYLEDNGWAGPPDVMRRLSTWNSWAAHLARERDSTFPPEEPGLVAFFVRRQVFDAGLEDEVSSMLDGCGFELLKTIDLDESEAAAAERMVRGGNWGPGRFSVGGGPPARIIIAFDVLPTPVAEELRANYPFLDNGRVLGAKQFCRGLVKERLPSHLRFNPLHSTDESREAWNIVERFAPGDRPAMRELIARRKAAFATSFEVVRDLTRIGRRAKIEVIKYGTGLGVKKTFRETSLRFMEREVAFMDAVSPRRPEILPVLERGSNYFITPFVEARPFRHRFLGIGFSKLMPLDQVRNAAELLRYLFALGYDPVDLAPHNLLADRQGRLTAIDFEFVHQGDGPIDPEKSACLDGLKGFEGDWPMRARWYPTRSKCLTDPYYTRWFSHTGLSRSSFLHDPPGVQRMKRLVNYPRFFVKAVLRRQSKWVRGHAKQIIKTRMPLLSRLAANSIRARGAWS